jgi:hypothetical protein
MEWAALVTWLITALFGFYMLSIYFRQGGPQQAVGIPARLVYGHFVLAAGGLVVWIAYVFSDSDVLAWIALVDLLVVAVGGFLMFGIWAKHRQAAATAAPAGAAGGATPAEQSFPVGVIGAHGLFAATTILLVLLTAVGVGGS